MNIFNINNKLVIISIILSATLLAGCSAMQVVNKQLEEGKLVPASAVQSEDFLNQYNHHLPSAQGRPLQIKIAMEKNQVMASGDRLSVQIGLSTSKPQLKPRNYHILLANSASLPAAQIDQMHEVASQFHTQLNSLPTGSRLSIDRLSPSSKPSPVASLLKPETSDSLETFIRRYAKIQQLGNTEHFILILGNHNKLSHKEKQNLIDLANIFRIKASSLSIVSVAHKADVAFINKMAEKGKGLVNLLTKDFNFKQWVHNEASYIQAKTIKDIALTMKTTNGASIKQLLSPENLYPDEKKINHTIKKLIQGNSYVLLAELNTPSINKTLRPKILDVSVEYFVVEDNRFYKDRKNAHITFSFDRNKTIAKSNKYIQRSKLILATQKVISDIVPIIEEKRYYQAVAMLSEHSIKLENYTNKYNDQELLRDRNIINRYAAKLIDYNDESFQAIKTWYDLSWDTDRFSAYYK